MEGVKTYVISVSGGIKLIELILDFIASICALIAPNSPRATAFLVASIGAFIITAVLVVLFMSNLFSKIVIPWFRVQLGFCVLWSIFYLITAALLIDHKGGWEITGGVFGLLAILAYLIDGYDNFTRFKV